MFEVYVKKKNIQDLNEQNRKLVIVEVREVSRSCINLEANEFNEEAKHSGIMNKKQH